MPAKSQKRDTHKVRSRKYRVGYTECIRGYLYTRVVNERRSTGMRCDAVDDATAQHLIDLHVEDYYDQSRQAEREAVHHPVYSMFEIIRDYKRELEQDMTPAQKKHFNQTVNYYCKTNFDLVRENEVLADDPIYQRILQRHKEKPLDQETRRKYMLTFRRLIEWAVVHKRIKVNTLKLMSIPKKKKKREIDKIIIKPEMMPALYKFFHDKQKLQRKAAEPVDFISYAKAYQLLYHTAMRVGEATQLKRSLIVPGQLIRINGKGDEYREFPLSRFPEADEAVRYFYEQENPDDKLLPWNNEAKLGLWFRKAKEELGWPDNAVLHSLRASAEWRWENELFLPYDLICDMAGHEPNVREAHYRQKRKASEMERAIDRHGK